MVKDHSDSHIGYSYRLTARVLLYAPSHRQDSTYHGLCYTSRGALAGTRNCSMGPPHEHWWRIDRTTHRTVSERSYHGATSCSLRAEESLEIGSFSPKSFVALDLKNCKQYVSKQNRERHMSSAKHAARAPGHRHTGGGVSVCGWIGW